MKDPIKIDDLSFDSVKEFTELLDQKRRNSQDNAFLEEPLEESTALLEQHDIDNAFSDALDLDNTSAELPNADTNVADVWDELELVANHPALDAYMKPPTNKVTPHSVAEVVSIKSNQRWTSKKLMPWAIAASVLFCAMLVTVSYQGLPQSYQVAKGSQRNVALDDGSTILMDSGSALTIYEGWGRRSITLEQGAAYFSVEKNPSKPFIVDSGDTQVRVLGTAFTVYRKGGHVEVVVEHGKVNVANDSPSVAQPIDQDLIQNQKLIIARDGNAQVQADINVGEALAWRQGLVYFKKESLSNIVSRMSDFYEQPIIFMNQKQRKISLTGTFKTDNIDKFIDALQSITDVKIERGQTGSVLIY